MIIYPPRYEVDMPMFFSGKPLELSLYEALAARMEAELPELSVRVQKTQISFCNRRLFAAASLPLRRRKDWPRQCLILTVGLGRRLDSPRVAVAVEPYPNRWTHHILLTHAAQLDGELMSWLREAYDFSMSK